MRPFLLGLALVAFGHFHSVAAKEQYFPAGVWGPPEVGSNWSLAERDAFLENWFGGNLARLKERPLWLERAKAGVPLAIRISVHLGAVIPDTDMIRFSASADGKVQFVFSGFALRTVDDPAGPGEDKMIKPIRGAGQVQPERAREILELVAEIAPFTNKTPSQDPGEDGLDGTVTVFEFSQGRTFNAMERWELSDTDGALGRLKAIAFEIARDSYAANY